MTAMIDTAALSDHYRIEVSGWSVSEEFFVDKTDLHRTEIGHKKLLLHHAVPEDTTESSLTSVPVAFAVESVQPMNSMDLCEMRLLRLRPRSRAQAGEEIVSYSVKYSSKTHEPKERSFQPEVKEVLHEA
jgi:delta-aminolevulinic acid dehydratase/porphobilinogen synthase